jgi:hypothetical protein
MNQYHSELNSTIPADIANLQDVTSVAVGDNHVCALLLAGSVSCWGWNGHGQLGDGTTSDEVAPTAVMNFLGTYQPDASIGSTWKGSFSGVGIFNSTGAQQRLTLKRNRGGAGWYCVRVTNSATAKDSFAILGPGGSRRFSVRYYLGDVNITKLVTAGSYVTPVLDSGSTLRLRISIAASSRARVGATFAALVLATSESLGTRVDAVRAAAAVKA